MDPIIDPSIEETVINSFDEYILCILDKNKSSNLS